MKSSRREFLRLSLGVAGAMAGTQAASSFADLAGPVPCPPTAWKKHGIIIEPTEPWEGDFVQCFTNSVEPLADGRWQIWYSSILPGDKYSICRAVGQPGEIMHKVRAAVSSGEAATDTFSIGNLPAGWRPVQPTHVQLSGGKHRLYFWAHGPQVKRYLVAESDNNLAYRVVDPMRPVLYHGSDRAAHGVASPDGVVLHNKKNAVLPEGEPVASPHLITNDAVTLYKLDDGSYELYAAALVVVPKGDPAYIPEDNAPGKVRVIDRLTSADGLHFENRKRVIQRDSRDAADQQFYYLAVTHTSMGRVGMLGHYRAAGQTMDLEWCYSPDGVVWERSARQAWLRRGDPPAADCMGIYSCNRLVHHNGLWHLFYTGTNHGHNTRIKYGKPRQVIMYATAPSIWG